MIAGLVVFLLLRRLRTVILTAYHDEVRSRFSRVTLSSMTTYSFVLLVVDCCSLHALPAAVSDAIYFIGVVLVSSRILGKIHLRHHPFLSSSLDSKCVGSIHLYSCNRCAPYHCCCIFIQVSCGKLRLLITLHSFIHSFAY